MAVLRRPRKSGVSRVLGGGRGTRQGTARRQQSVECRTCCVAHALACRALGIRHVRTRPRRPRTNGKAERFTKTMRAGWNDGAIYATSRERAAALDGRLWTYNHRRRHGALSHKPPIAHLDGLNNLARVLQLALSSALDRVMMTLYNSGFRWVA